MNRVVRKVGAIGALVAASILFALPAQALGSRTLPAGETLFTLDNDTTVGTLYSLDPQTAAPTAAGDPCTPCDVSTWDANSQGAYNPVNGHAYWVGFSSAGTELVETDVSTGVPTSRGTFDDGSRAVAIASIAIDDLGNAFGFDSSELYSIDLHNAQVTPIGALTPVASLKAFAFNPADQTFYAVGHSGAVNSTLFSVDVSSGALTAEVSGTSFPMIESGEKRVMALAFDTDGQMWGIDNNRKLFSAASVATFATSLELLGAIPSPGPALAPLTGDIPPPAPHSIFIQYTATRHAESSSGASSSAIKLAETGSDSATMLAIALGAMAATGAGIALIARARRRNS